MSAVYLTLDDAAKNVQMSPTWIKARMRDGSLKYLKLGTKPRSPIRILKTDLDAMMVLYRGENRGTGHVADRSASDSVDVQAFEKTVHAR